MKKLPIREVLEHYGVDHIPYRHGWVKVKCPLHDDTQASASMNSDAGYFSCFACMPRSPLDNGGSKALDGLDIVAIKEGCADYACAVECAKGLFGDGFTDVLQESSGKSSRRVFGEGTRPKRGQRNAFQAGVRRRTFTGS